MRLTNMFYYYYIKNYVILLIYYYILQLVAHAQGLQVELSPAAEKIIHGYYMASRRVRSQGQGVNMSVASIKLL